MKASHFWARSHVIDTAEKCPSFFSAATFLKMLLHLKRWSTMLSALGFHIHMKSALSQPKKRKGTFLF